MESIEDFGDLEFCFEPKKRRFHPLRGLRRIFRRKSRGAADARLGSRNGDRDSDLINRDREEVTLRHPAGRPEEARSRSASELLTDSCDRERRLIGWPRKYRVATTVRTHKSFNNVFLRRSGVEESFAKLRGGAGQLSVSHDSVFPGEVPHTRPLSSLDPLATLERRQSKASDEGVHKDYSSRVPHNNRISLRVLEQIKTVIENRNQLASATSTESTHAAHAAGERYQQETTENRFTHFEKHDRTVEESLIRMVVSHRETTISSNIRAIIEQLNLNPVERRRLIDRTRENARMSAVDPTTKITIGVYGCNERNDRLTESTSKIKIGVYKEKIEKIETIDCTDSPAKIGLYECKGKDEKFDSVDFTSNSGGKVTIGVYGRKQEECNAIEAGTRIDTRDYAGKITIGVYGSGEKSQKVEDAAPKPRVEPRSKSKAEMRQRVPPIEKPQEEREEVTRISEDVADRETSTPKEDLPQLECASLSHTAAHHRISVRPKNRRPPRRVGATSTVSGSAITTITESPDAPDSLETVTKSSSSSPIEKKNPTALRKSSSSRLSRNSDIFEELESKLPLRKPASTASLSPDSLDSMNATGKIGSQESTVEQPEDRENLSSHEIKPVARKASSRVSKGSDVYEELEAKLPRRRSSSSRLSKSPDSLESGSPGSISKSTEGFDKLVEHDESSRHVRKLQNSMSKSTEGFEKLVEHVEIRPVSRRLYNHQMSKSIEGFERLVEDEEVRLPVRRFSNVVTSKSSDGPLKCADSLEAIETMISDDSIERRRSSFELRPRKSPAKLMSMSSENFETLEDSQLEELDVRPELQKRSSASDINLARARRYSKLMSKSTESFDAIDVSSKVEESNRSSVDLGKGCWRSSKRAALSSESSDNLELEDRLENRRARRPPKRIPSTSVVDIFPLDSAGDDERRPTPTRKPSRLKKSSESSELGSTDTLDSERRNKSSDSTETLDSLEKDAEQEARDDDVADSVAEKRDKNDSWSAKTTGTELESAGDLTDESNRSPIVSPDKSYWRQTSDSKENIDIHQLLAITIVTRMADNGNNQRNNSAAYPKKKQQQISSSPPSSPVVQQDDNKMIFNNLLASKNDEDLQNMLNGNISEVSTDTKSFKEKLIMFEKLGK